MTPNEVLLKAADYIAQYGHHKGDYVKRQQPGVASEANPPACALGAIRMVSEWGGVQEWAEKLLAEELGHSSKLREGPNSGQLMSGQLMAAIPWWNDKPETTAEDVILALKRAASRVV